MSLICVILALHLSATGNAQNASTKAAEKQAKKSATTARDSAPLPTWEDTLIRSDVSLLPAAAQSAPDGYYPTRADIALMGDRDYSRTGGSGGASEIGPDALMQNSMGLYPYQSGEQDFYTRNADSFNGANRVLGLFTPQQALTYEPEIYPGLAVSMDGSFGSGSLFTRTFDPNKAHVKAGPLAFDLLWVGAGAIWSDYHGSKRTFSGGREDGWVGYVELGLRGYLRLTDSFYLSWAVNLMYLPGSNELAFQTLNGGWPQLGLEFFYQKQVKAWSLYLSDRFYGRPGLDIFSNFSLRGQDQAGRYMFGYYGRTNRTGLYDSDNVFFVNQINAQATRMLGATDWRFWALYQHMDFWQTFGFDNYQFRDTWQLSAAYEGNKFPFAPRFVYMMTTADGYEALTHQIQMQLAGRITENVTVQGMLGYFWTSGLNPSHDSVIWSLALNHRFSQRGSHSIQVGEQYLTDSYSPESVLATYYRYYVAYQLMSRLQASAFAQYSYGDRITTAYNNANSAQGYFEQYLVGGTLELQVFDYTRILATAAFERSDGNETLQKIDRWIYRLQLQQQLSTRLSFRCGYQYESLSGNLGFDEHMVNIALRRYF